VEVEEEQPAKKKRQRKVSLDEIMKIETYMEECVER